MESHNYLIRYIHFTICVLLGTMTNSEDLRIPALGRRARFFEIYNLEQDEFTRIVAIPRANERKYRVKTVPIYNREYSYRSMTSMTEFIDSMNYGASVKAGVALSCFKGSVESSFNKKNEFKSTTMSMTTVMSVKVKTIREEIDPCDSEIWQDDSHSLTNKQISKSGRIMGDHVLAAKEYGFEVNIFIKLSSKSSEESSSLEASLKTSAEAMIVSVAASISTNKKNVDKTTNEDVTITVDTRYASFPYGVPTEVNKIAEFVKNVTAYLNDNANLNGSVIDYIMRPSSEIEKCRKVGSEKPKSYTDFDRISERMFTFLLELDRQETENDRFRSRFDVVKECLNSTEYAQVVREILDTRMVLMDMRIELIESIDKFRKGVMKTTAVMKILGELIVRTVQKQFCIKTNIPVGVMHKVNFLFALWNDRDIICLSRNENPSLHYDSYVKEKRTLAFFVFRSSDFTSGKLGFSEYFMFLKYIKMHQESLTDEQKKGEQVGEYSRKCDIGKCVKEKSDGVLNFDEKTGSPELIAFLKIKEVKNFVALNCDNNYDVCGILTNAGLYHGWNYKKLEYFPVIPDWDLLYCKMEAVDRFYTAEREIQTPERIASRVK